MQLERDQKADCFDHRRLLDMKSAQITLPAIDELRQVAREAMTGIAPHSVDFNRVIRRIVPRIVVFPYRLAALTSAACGYSIPRYAFEAPCKAENHEIVERLQLPQV